MGEFCRTAILNLFLHRFVQQEVSLGDRAASQKRLDVLGKLTLLDTPKEALDSLSNDLINAGALPLKARIDSFHIAIAAINNVQYLATWNFKHIANINKNSLDTAGV